MTSAFWRRAAARAWKAIRFLGPGQPSAVALLAVLAAACARETEAPSPVGPSCPVTGITGTVMVAGHGVPAALHAWSHSPLGSGCQAEADSSGRFFLPLVTGEYWLHLSGSSVSDYPWSAGAPAGIYDSSGVVTVEEGKLTRADFVFGDVVAHLTLPPGSFVERASLELVCLPGTEQRQYYGHQAEDVAPGPVTLHSMGVPAGVYQMKLHTYPARLDVLLPGTLNPRLADSVVVRAGATTDYTGTVQYSQRRIRGRVKGSWESAGGESFPSLTFLDEDSVVVGDARTNGGGYFVADLPYAERVRVNVKVGQVSRWIGGSEFRDATSFELDSEQDTEIPPFTESGLSVRLIAPQPWMALAAACELVDEEGRSVRAGNGNAASDQFLISNLRSGRYRLDVTPQTPGTVDWVGQWFDHADSPATARVIEVPPDGGVASVVVRLNPGGEIRGSIRNETGGLASHRLVIVSRADSLLAWAHVYTGSAGSFRIRGLPDGNWKVGASATEVVILCKCSIDAADYSWVWYGGASFDSAAVIAVHSEQLVEGIDIRVPE